MADKKFTIGQLSELTGVPASTLRYYDERKLFQPENTDPESGYRYYGESQLFELNCILAWRELGFSLSEIKPLLKSGDFSDLGSHYDRQEKKLLKKIGELKMQLQKVRENRSAIDILSIEHANKSLIFDTPIKEQLAGSSFVCVPFKGILDAKSYRSMFSRLTHIQHKKKLLAKNHIVLFNREGDPYFESGLFCRELIKTPLPGVLESVESESRSFLYQLPEENVISMYCQNLDLFYEKIVFMQNWIKEAGCTQKGIFKVSFLIESQISMDPIRYVYKLESVVDI